MAVTIDPKGTLVAGPEALTEGMATIDGATRKRIELLSDWIAHDVIRTDVFCRIGAGAYWFWGGLREMPYAEIRAFARLSQRLALSSGQAQSLNRIFRTFMKFQDATVLAGKTIFGGLNDCPECDTTVQSPSLGQLKSWSAALREAEQELLCEAKAFSEVQIWIDETSASLPFQREYDEQFFSPGLWLKNAEGTYSLPPFFQLHTFLPKMARVIAHISGARAAQFALTCQDAHRALWRVKGPGRILTRASISVNSKEILKSEIVCIIDEDKIICLQVISGLSDPPSPPDARTLANALERLQGERIEIVSAEGTLSLVPTKCFGIIVVGILPLGTVPDMLPGPVFSISLEALEEMCAHLDDYLQLTVFLADQMDLRSKTKLLSWDLLDTFMTWRPQESLYIGARALGFMSVCTHAGSEAQWQRLAHWGEVRRGLLQLGISDLEEFITQKPTPESSVRLWNPITQEGWTLLPGEVTWAVGIRCRKSVDSDGVMVSNGALEGLAYCIEHARVPLDAGVKSAARRFAIGIEIEPYVGMKDADAADWKILEVRADRILLSWNCSQESRALARGSTTELEDLWREGLIKTLQSAGLGIVIDAEKVKELWPPDGKKAWAEDKVRFGVCATDIGEPLGIRPFHIQQIRRQVAMVLQRAGVLPGTYEAADATRIENSHIYPTIKEALIAVIQRYDKQEALIFAMQQLEQCCGQREIRLRQLSLNATRTFYAHDPIERLDEIESDSTRSGIGIRTFIEMLLMSNARGQCRFNHERWSEALALGQELAQSGIRSEANHFKLIPSQLEVSDNLEVRALRGTPGFGLGEYERARAAATVESFGQPPPQKASGNSFIDSHPELSGVDAAMKTSLGFGVNALTHGLASLAGWPSDRTSPTYPISVVDSVDLEQHLGVEISPSEISSLLDWLTLKATDLSRTEYEPWLLRERPIRLMTRPLPQLPSEKFIVAPWSCEVCLNVYLRYLLQGLLPFPDESLPPILRDALAEFRDTRNRNLEREVSALLNSIGLSPLSRIKKPQHIGLTALPGEIDLLVTVAPARCIWIIEVKDPAEIFSVGQIARQINTFWGDSPTSYSNKLQAKVLAVKNGIAGVCKKLQLSDGQWSVSGAFVTRRAIPAGFCETRFPVVVADSASLKTLLMP